MKKLIIKSTFLFALFAGMLTSCVQNDDTALPEIRVPFYAEEFEITPTTVLSLAGWTNFAEEGTVKWSARTFDNDGYAQFNTFGSPDVSNIAWLISPKIDISEHPTARFTFRSAQNFVSDDKNKLEVFVSTDYDGTNVLAATWEKIDAKVATKATTGYVYVNGGSLDLAKYQEAGAINVAFRASGSGTNTALDGLFQVDGLYVYTPK